LTLLGTTVRDNRAQRGGGILNGFDPGGSTVTLGEGTNVTGNRADGRGAGVFNAGALVLEGTAIVSNTAEKRGGGIFNVTAGTVSLDGVSSVTGNTPDDCVGTSAC
jgi:hypothetical protein